MAAREGKKALKEAHDAWLHGWIMEMENTGKLAEGDEGSRSGQIEKNWIRTRALHGIGEGSAQE
jgi:hypothetical protein